MNKITPRAKNLEEFWKFNNIEPKNKLLYIQAITHSSYVALHKSFKSYEQLEFLGDAVLQFLSSDYIFKKYITLEPGTQTRVRSTAVRTEALGEIAENLGLIDILKTGIKQTEWDVKNSTKVKADVFESILAAIYLDLGLNKAREFLQKHIFPIIDQFHSKENKDPKTTLQEYFQSLSKTSVTYVIEQLEDKTFVAKAIHDKQIYGKGAGVSKKDAEQNAAKDALSKLK